ncbi:MAG: DinB family protein [Planctomycetota bacterium]
MADGAASVMNRIDIAIEQLRQTRRYTRMVLDHTDRDRWFEIAEVGPVSCGSHIAWQVGHIAWAQSVHVLKGVCALDGELTITPRWAQCFGKGTTPSADATRYPAVAELDAALDLVLDAALGALPTLPDAALDEPVIHPTGLIPDKFALLLFNTRHEMLHVGQIGLIRRRLGADPYR